MFNVDGISPAVSFPGSALIVIQLFHRHPNLQPGCQRKSFFKAAAGVQALPASASKACTPDCRVPTQCVHCSFRQELPVRGDPLTDERSVWEREWEYSQAFYSIRGR
jgi:hypothetical protein